MTEFTPKGRDAKAKADYQFFRWGQRRYRYLSIKHFIESRLGWFSPPLGGYAKKGLAWGQFYVDNPQWHKK